MGTADRIKAKIQGLIDTANLMTGAADTNLTSAVSHLVAGYGGGEGGAAVNAGLKTYKVKEGATVAAGDFVELYPEWGEGTVLTEALGAVAVVPLSASKAVVVYSPAESTDTNSAPLRAALLSADGESVTVSEPVVLGRSKKKGSIAAVALSDSKVLVVDQYGEWTIAGQPNSYSGMACVLTLSGDTITMGERVNFYAHPSNELSVTALTDSKALVVFRDSNSYGYAVPLTVDGTAITAGTALNIESSFKNPKVVTMTDSTALVAYETYDLTAGRAIVLKCPSTTVTKGSVYTFRSAATSDLALATLDPRRAVLVYRDAASTGYLTATVLQVDNASVTTQNSPSLTIASSGGLKPTVTRIGTDTALVVANCYTSSGANVNAQVLTVGASNITKAELTLYTISTRDDVHAIVTTGEGSALLVSARATAAEYRGLTVDGTTVTKQTSGGTSVAPITSEKYSVGVAKNGGAAGGTVYVFRSGTQGDGINAPTFTVYGGDVTISGGSTSGGSTGGGTHDGGDPS